MKKTNHKQRPHIKMGKAKNKEERREKTVTLKKI